MSTLKFNDHTKALQQIYASGPAEGCISVNTRHYAVTSAAIHHPPEPSEPHPHSKSTKQAQVLSWETGALKRGALPCHTSWSQHDPAAKNVRFLDLRCAAAQGSVEHSQGSRMQEDLQAFFHSSNLSSTHQCHLQNLQSCK